MKNPMSLVMNPVKFPFSSETWVDFCNNYLMEQTNASSLGSGREDAYIRYFQGRMHIFDS